MVHAHAVPSLLSPQFTGFRGKFNFLLKRENVYVCPANTRNDLRVLQTRGEKSIHCVLPDCPQCD